MYIFDLLSCIGITNNKIFDKPIEPGARLNSHDGKSLCGGTLY